MKPSMSMLAWFMREAKPVCSIKNDRPIISGVRFLADDSMQLSPDFVYVGAASHFFSDEKYAGAFIVVHGQDFLLFNVQDPDMLFNKLLNAIDFYDQWENRLETAARENAPLQTFMDLGEEVMGDFFVVCDMETNLLAASNVKPEEIAGTSWEDFFANKRVSVASMNTPLKEKRTPPPDPNHPVPHRLGSRSPSIHDIICMHLIQDGEAIAYLAVNQTIRSATEMQFHLIPVFCRYLISAREFTSRKAVSQSAARVFSTLISGETPDVVLLSGFRKKLTITNYRIVYFKNLLREDTIHTNVFMRFLRSKNVLCTQFGEGVAAMIENDGWRENLESLIRSSGFSGCCCGVSTASRDLQSASVRCRQAVFAAGQNREGVFCCEDFALSYLLEVLKKDESAAFLLHPAIERLSEYDSENQNELLLTLNEYLKQNKNQQKTLEVLQIHRSTLKYRLQRITDLTGIRLDDPKEEAYLRLSMLLKFGLI